MSLPPGFFFISLIIPHQLALSPSASANESNRFAKARPFGG
jgi:hypothetical protein